MAQLLSSTLPIPGSKYPCVEDEQSWPGGLCGPGLRAHTQCGHHLLLQVVGQGWIQEYQRRWRLRRLLMGFQLREEKVVALALL